MTSRLEMIVCMTRIRVVCRLVIAHMIFICLSCDNTSNMGNHASVYDLEGPRGLVRSSGPWLIRVGVPHGALAERYKLSVRFTREVNAGEMNGGDDHSDEALNFEVEDRLVSLVESGRPDLLFGLIPDVPIGIEVSYQLLSGTSEVTSSHSFKPIIDEAGEVSPLEFECLINLDSPDPKTPVSARDDRAPQAGIQRIYQVSVYISRDRVIDVEESTSLSGLVTLDWLSVDSHAAHEPGTLLTLSGGRARSTPINTPLGAQKLLIRALTERGASCDTTIEFTSF